MHSAITRLLAPACDVVDHATDGAGLLEAAARSQPDVVLLDLKMPTMDGLAACRHLKAAAPHVKVIVFTAADDEAIREKAFDVGASAFVLKFRAADDLLPEILKALAGDGRFGS